MTSRPPTTSHDHSSHQYASLLSAGEREFDQEIKVLEVRELLGLIACLQKEMALEQSHFDRLNSHFQNRKVGLHGSKGEEDAVELSAALCRSQIRLAQLCNRNMRCFTQQAARAQQDRSTEILRKSNDPQSPQVGVREKMCHNSSVFTGRANNNYVSDEDEDEEAMDRFHTDTSFKGSGDWRRAPSVEDILQSVRSLRHDKDEKSEPVTKLNGVSSSKLGMYNGGAVVDAKSFHNSYNNNNNGEGPGENLVPTATQLLLRMRPTKPQPSEEQNQEEVENLGDVEKDGKRNKVRKSIFQNYIFEPKEADKQDEPQTALSDDVPDDSQLPPPPSPLPPTDDVYDYGEASTNEPIEGEEEDEILEVHANGSSRYQEHVSELQSEPNDVLDTLTELEHPPLISRTATDDVEAVIPSIIDQFIDEPDQRQRCRKTDVNWNLDDLLNHLYELPQPKPPAIPPAAYINMEGYLEKLPIGRRQGTFWNAWKRRYFKLKDGYLFCYQGPKTEEAIVCLQLMGGRIDIVESQILVDDGKGHCIMLRCNSRTETERWRRALLTHTAENYLLTYAQPVVPYPQFYEKVLIVDIGSCSVRAGILCNQPTLPQVYFPTVCAEEKLTGFRIYGKEALSTKVRLNSTITFPLRPSAKITKFTVDMIAVKGILTKVFEDLNVDPAQYEIQLSLPRSFPFKSQTDVLDLLMTEFGVQGVNLMAQTVLALCSYNTTSGVVVDIGERLEVVPIVDGYVIESGVSRIPYGGPRLMDHLSHFLMQRHYGLSSITESFLLRYVLENSCYCALNYNAELQNYTSQPQNFEVNISVGHFFQRDEAPWESITLDGGRFQAPEGLFRPEAWGLDNAGIHKLVWKAIQECSLDVRKEMSRGIYLSGGVTMLPGLSERLQSEMERLTPPTVQPKVHASPYRAHAAYLGACNWALSAGFHEAKISRNEWIANGSGCLKKWHF